MENKNSKCVMVIDENLPMGIISNTAAIMGITLGKHAPETVGPDVIDKTGNSHLGIIDIPVPILKGNKEIIKDYQEIIYVFLTIFLYLLKCPQSLILSALRAFFFCGKPHISRSIFLYFPYQSWLKSW
ncbi:DUF2000 domain-containing protein [Clostridioides difficile]|nr:DUF2000 domain-containing protein [Clostridioides difficile]MCJ1770320.1 DUF2000 domain-containing protein [Clostridioides difficile]